MEGERIRDAALDAKTIVQVDATVIVGVLFFLTLVSFIPSATIEENTAVFGVVTPAIAVPFAVSAILIVYPRNVKKDFFRVKFRWEELTDISPTSLFYAKVLTVAGFVYLAVILIALMVVSNLIPPSEQLNCGNNPVLYNVSHLWECSKFTGGSLAERCAREPERYNMSISGCSRFIPPSG